MKTNKSLLSLAIAGGLLAVSQSSNAAGFQLAEYSATGLGRAYAGEAAMADNASSQWRNPALLGYLEGTQISLGAIYVDPNIDVKGNVAYNGSNYNVSSKDYADDAVIPNAYLSHQINDQFFMGIALSSNYGMKTDLGSNYAASHFGNKAEVKTMEANVNFAYKVDPAVTIGTGVRYIMAEGHFGATAPAHGHAAYAGDTLKYMEGDTTDWGWQVGTVWQINEDHRLGLTYKSEVNLKLKGKATGAGFFGPGNADVTKSGSLPLTLPATAEVASFHQLTETLALHASFNWTDWSSFEKLEANVDTIGHSMVKIENWRDNYRFAVGSTYQIDEKWLVRSGIAYDTSAVSDKNRSATIPETDRTWLSIGAGYKWSDQLNFDAGFTYIIAKDASINEPRGYTDDAGAAAIGGTFVGETSGNVLIFGIQASYKF
ncbi:aromatic hydrocarbon degradation protein [Vibrio sp. MACH09]|uniref:outer membrane protein transport protein n=1 Tax=Vibrio sp. MACH09 TaxID=3025122 RepID=UPI00279446A3|nr:outer membrane protein transport protein [Vibrio sp. MACH09]GLO61521.1 aromatic hydrocarbon degradation protein [Vibrio sp. MACH09]